jgi:hypothetical protein
MRARHFIATLAILFAVLAGVDVAVRAFAAPRATAVSDTAPPVSPLLFDGD